MESRGDRLKALRPVERLARQQTNAIAVDARLDAVAAEFDLVDLQRPALVNEQREARFYEGWHLEPSGRGRACRDRGVFAW